MKWWIPKLLGDRGERAAARYLRQQGYKILARNWKNRIGELDIIAQDGETLVFVEVKTRASSQSGLPHEAVDFAKQKKLTQVALSYLKRFKLLDRRARFDVVSVLWPEGVKYPEIEHYKNAFESSGFGQLYS